MALTIEVHVVSSAGGKLASGVQKGKSTYPSKCHPKVAISDDRRCHVRNGSGIISKTMEIGSQSPNVGRQPSSSMRLQKAKGGRGAVQHYAHGKDRRHEGREFSSSRSKDQDVVHRRMTSMSSASQEEECNVSLRNI